MCIRIGSPCLHSEQSFEFRSCILWSDQSGHFLPGYTWCRHPTCTCAHTCIHPTNSLWRMCKWQNCVLFLIHWCSCHDVIMRLRLVLSDMLHNRHTLSNSIHPWANVRWLKDNELNTSFFVHMRAHFSWQKGKFSGLSIDQHAQDWNEVINSLDLWSSLQLWSQQHGVRL